LIILRCCFAEDGKEMYQECYKAGSHLLFSDVAVAVPSLGSLSKPQRQRQQQRRQTKGLMNKTIAVHVRYKSLYISLPSSAKQRKMTKFWVF